MRRRSLLILLVAVVLAPAACASGGGNVARRDSRILTPEEIATIPVTNLYEAVDRLRPRWLELRDVRSLGSGAGQIVVYLNNSYVGGPETLRQFQAHQIVRVRYLDAAQATATLQGYPSDRHVVAGIVLETAER